LIPIAGKPIILRLIEGIQSLYRGPIGQIGFIVKDLQANVRAQLVSITQNLGAQAQFYEQTEPLGTAHAIACAATLLEGPILIVFADTLFKATTPLDITKEGIIWVHQVDDPSAFGVVTLREDGTTINQLVEKPTQFVSNLAIVGIYYIKDGAALLAAIQKIMANPLPNQSEYHLTTALSVLQETGTAFIQQNLEEWLDCGNKMSTLHTNERFLDFVKNQPDLVHPTAKIDYSYIIPPNYIGPGAIIKNSVIGPYVSVGEHTQLINARIQNSIIQNHSKIFNANICHSMVGNSAQISGKSSELNLGDYSQVEL